MKKRLTSNYSLTKKNVSKSHIKTSITKIISVSLAGVMLSGCGLSGRADDTVISEQDVVGSSANEEKQNNEGAETALDQSAIVQTSASYETEELTAKASEILEKEQFTERDTDASYDEKTATNILFSGSSASVTGTGAVVDGTTVTISSEGTYILEGSLEDGQIVVDAADTDKVQLVLAGVTITNDDSACIYVSEADKVFITLASGSENTLSDTGVAYVQSDSETTVDGVIFSRSDLTLNGEGQLTVNASYKNGIVGKDDLKFTGGTYLVNASNHGIEGKDSVRISGGTYTVEAAQDAINSGNDEDENKGYIYIEDGSLNLTAGDDGIHAETALIINGGNITVADSYEGMEGDTIDIYGGDISVNADDDGLNAAVSAQDTSDTQNDMQMHMGAMDAQPQCYINISGGSLHINAEGDGIDSNGYIYFNGGTTIVDGPSESMNASIDYGSGAVMSGGTLVAVGVSGMNEAFSDDSAQNVILYTFESVLAQGTTISVTNSEGSEILSYTLSKKAQSVYFSSAELTNGDYSITAGDEEGSFTVESVFTRAGSEQAGMGGGRGQGGFGQGGPEGRGGQGRPNGGNTAPDFGEKPQMPEGMTPPEGGEMPQGEMPPTDGQDSDSSSSGNI